AACVMASFLQQLRTVRPGFLDGIARQRRCSRATIIQGRTTVRYRLTLASFALLFVLPIPHAFAQTVLITGANSGIGLEFTRQYVEKGWTVIVTHRRSETPKTLADIAAKYSKLRIEKLDVTSEDQVHALAAKLADVPIDVLINNAGVYN